MLEHPLRLRLVAAALAALAGYVDAVGFLRIGGFFVSFMSGNSTRLSLGLVDAPAQAVLAGGLIATFLAGVIAGFLIAHGLPRRVRLSVMAAVALLLAFAGVADVAGFAALAAFVAAFAMGAENAACAGGRGMPVGLTYMTGTLVKLGEGIAAALLGGSRTAWWPYAVHWLALVLGAVLGSLADRAIGAFALLLAAAFAGVLACVLARTPPRLRTWHRCFPSRRCARSRCTHRPAART